MLEVFLYYKQTIEEDWKPPHIEITRDTLYFEENQLGMGKLKPETYFPEPNEEISYNNPEIFNKEIIDTLTDKGDEGARDLIEEYIKDWWEDNRGLDQIIKDWVKSNKWIVDYIEVECLI